ncbi:MAG: hypothetical protein Q4B68_01265 [Bacteroidales bacterium]|nr:hypothetical protein [Bacteroidales bacterium]
MIDVPAQKIRSKKSAHECFCLHFPEEEWPFHGGWGYSKDDAVVLDIEKDAFAVMFEPEFLEKRAIIETFFSQSKRSRCFGSKSRMLGQSLQCHDGKHYDVVTVEVTAIPFIFREELLKEYNDNNQFKDDRLGLEKYHKKMESKMIRYKTECWFDLSASWK